MQLMHLGKVIIQWPGHGKARQTKKARPESIRNLPDRWCFTGVVLLVKRSFISSKIHLIPETYQTSIIPHSCFLNKDWEWAQWQKVLNWFVVLSNTMDFKSCLSCKVKSSKIFGRGMWIHCLSWRYFWNFVRWLEKSKFWWLKGSRKVYRNKQAPLREAPYRAAS